MFKDKNKNIINQVKGKSYNSQQTLIQKIKQNLSNSVTGTFSNTVFISDFIEFLNLHIFNRKFNEIIEKRFTKLNIPMLYMIFIIRKYYFQNFSENFVSNEKQVEIVKNLLKDFIKEYNNNYEDYYMDIQRYNITYNIIVYDNFIIDFDTER
ncbi:hypothetical protein H8356DRAFT_1389034 [Neocallimastix lanati (nom. inval.)]|nr:hypothetical protein H8356DRAFT_1389034 [Neocallimastix sp. JGI-2020a]